MAELAFDTLIEGKPVAVDVDGTLVCVAKVAMKYLLLLTLARILKLRFQRVR